MSFFPKHLSVKDRVINGCLLQKVTTTKLILLDAFDVQSDSISFSVTYHKNKEIGHDNLHGHQIKTTLERSNVKKLKHNIPKQFLVSQETCLYYVMIVLSEMKLPPSIQERLIRYISRESVDFNRRHEGKGGLSLEFNVKVNVESWVRIRCVNKGKDNACQVQARLIKTKVSTEMDCPICLTELSSVGSRVELQCSHVFHSYCLTTWLKKNPSCPICRSKAIGQTVSIY